MAHRLRLVALLTLLLGLALPPASAGDEPRPAFPVGGLLPKQEIGADRFLAAHPDYDGRGVVVAIFDTGVDPGAPGLQTTSDGKPKIVDVIDGTGSGDVDTSKTVEATDGTIPGLSGRTLRLDPAWKNPSKAWRVGLKALFELLPRELLPRLKKRQRKDFAEAQRAAVGRLERELDAYDAAHPKPDEAEKAKHEDLEKRLDLLRALDAKYEHTGPIVDCVVWNDGTDWWAVIDTDEDGDLQEETALRSFRVAREYATYSKDSMVNYCMNVYDEGDTLSIVVDVGDHGTHVAGIVAAHFPDQPELNGIAPGAQIVSVKIGDTRLGSSAFGTGPERGAVAVLRHGCDLINMSYGGADRRPNHGRVIELYRELVNKHRVIFVSSAGNEGPALSTVGSPGGTTGEIIGVGAYVSPAMMKAQMSILDDLRGTHYTWSSRGPTLDGDLGVDLSAPGGAIAPVPTWTLQRTMQMSGTSMSAPNACGAIALLLSGMKAEGMAPSPHRVRRALVNTAAPIEGVDVWGAGHGMLQVDKAWEHLVQNKDRADEDARYEVTLPRRDDARGVYLREPHEVDQVLQTSVRVSPKLHEDTAHERRVAFEQRLALESTQPWIEVAEHLHLTHGGSWFGIRVDPTQLPAGAHYGEIRAFDVAARERGPLFRVPVTVVRPLPLDAAGAFTWRETIDFEPGQIERRFFAVPPGATWADLTVRAVEAPTDKLFVVEATQLAPGRAYAETHKELYIRMHEGETEGYGLDVAGGRTLELALSQYWSSLGKGRYEVELHLHGIVPSPSELVMDGGGAVARVDVGAPLRAQELAPVAQLTTLRKQLRAEEAQVRTLSAERDGLAEGRRMHEAVLTYLFELEEPVTAKLGVRLDDEGGGWQHFSSMLWQLFDEGKRRIGNGHAGGTEVDLEKGSYTLRFHVRHPDRQRLLDARDAVAFLDIELSDPIDLSFHAFAGDAFAGKDPIDELELRTGERRALFLRAAPWDDLPYEAEPGDVLLGTFRLGKPDGDESGPGRRPAGYPLRVSVPPEPNDYDEEKDEVEPADKRTPIQKAEDAVRDALLKELATLREDGEDAAYKQLFQEARTRYAGHVPLLVEWLRYTYGEGPPYEDDGRRARVEQAADKVIAAIDRDALAKALGVRYDPKDPEELATKKRVEERRDALVEALTKKARVLLEAGKARTKDFEAAWADLRRYADITEAKYARFRYAMALADGFLGKALEIAREAIKDSPFDKQGYRWRIELYEKLGWAHWAALEKRWLLRRFPPGGYPPF